MNDLLRNIGNGMAVYDRDGDRIGKVEMVKMSDEDPNRPGPETVSVSPIEARERHSLIDDIADAFRTDELPDTLRERLLREGFIRMDADGLFASDRYVLPDQIQSVTDDGVTLKVTKSELVKRPYP